MILVAFACNDPETGVFDGGLRALQIHGDESAPEVELEGPSFPEAQDEFEWDDLGSLWWRYVKVAGRRFACGPQTEYYGNRCWSAALMKALDLLRLLTLLRDLGWHCSAANSELFDAWKSGEPLTLEVLTAALEIE